MSNELKKYVQSCYPKMKNDEYIYRNKKRGRYLQQKNCLNINLSWVQTPRICPVLYSEIKMKASQPYGRTDLIVKPTTILNQIISTFFNDPDNMLFKKDYIHFDSYEKSLEYKNIFEKEYVDKIIRGGNEKYYINFKKDNGDYDFGLRNGKKIIVKFLTYNRSEEFSKLLKERVHNAMLDTGHDFGMPMTFSFSYIVHMLIADFFDCGGDLDYIMR